MSKLQPVSQMTSFERLNMTALMSVECQTEKRAMSFTNNHRFNPYKDRHWDMEREQRKKKMQRRQSIAYEIVSPSMLETEARPNTPVDTPIDETVDATDATETHNDVADGACCELEHIHVELPVKTECNPMHMQDKTKKPRLFRSLLRKESSAKW